MARREMKAPLEGREGISRRRFIQAAEVAALSLFGVLGLDAVTERVAQRIAEMRGIDRLADRVAEEVRRNGAAYVGGYCSPP